MEENIMMELIKGLADNVIGIIGSGNITAEDYDTVLIPAIHEKLKKYKKIRLLYQLTTDYKHYELGAYLEDAKVTWHTFSFEKIAFVSDVHWMRDSINIYKLFMPMQIKVFSNNEIEKAKEWIGA
jgi:SpoIIAA-like